MSLLPSYVTNGGRIVIPAEIRKLMGISTGDEVILSYHDGELHISTRKQRLKQAKALVKEGVGKRSLADELLEERRAEIDD